MSATVAEAATELSFAEFLERCIPIGALPPPPLPIPTPPLDAATQTIPHIAVSQDASTQLSLEEFSLRCVHSHNPSGVLLHLLRTMFSAPRVPDPSLRYFLTRLCRRLCTASHLTMPPHNYRSRSSSSGAPFPMTLSTAKPRHRHIAMLAAPHLHNPLTLLLFCSPSSASHATVTRTLRPHVCHHSRLRLSRSMPVSALHMENLLKQPRCDLVCVHSSQSRPHSHMSQAGTHPVRSATACKRSASTALAGTHSPVVADPRAGTGPFSKPRALVLPVVKFGHSKPDTLIQPTAISCIINTVSLSFSGIQARRGGTPPISLRRPVEGSMRLFFKKPVITSPTSPISSLRMLATRTLLSCSTRTPSSLTLWCLPSGKTPHAKVLGAWFYSSFQYTNGHILLNTHSQCRCQET